MISKINIVSEIPYRSSLHKQALALRYSVLRKPIGEIYSLDELALDKDCQHFAALSETGEVIGSVSLLKTDNGHKIRQMAVANHLQGFGIGEKLIRHLESEIQKQANEPTLVYMSARSTAIGFYQKLGYRTEGEEYLEVGIPHIHMQKTLDYMASYAGNVRNSVNLSE